MSEDLETLKRQLADAKGRIKAVELDSYEIKRNAKLATEQAEALQAETANALATASEQMKTAHAIGCAIFGMAELGKAFVARKVTAARVVHREAFWAGKLQQFCEAAYKGDLTLLKQYADSAKEPIAVIKADGEAARAKAAEYALAQGFKNFEKVWEGLVNDV